MTRNSRTGWLLASFAIAAAVIGWLVWPGALEPPSVPSRSTSSAVPAGCEPEVPLEVESERVVTAHDPAPAPAVARAAGGALPEPDDEPVLLRIHVIEDSGTPVARAYVSLRLASQRGWEQVGSAETDADGRCELDALPGRSHRLVVHQESRDLDTRGVPALAAGQELDIEIVVPYEVVHGRLDLDFFGVVVDDTTGAPIVGASIRGERERTDIETSTGAFGAFLLRAASWKTSAASASAAGYARRCFLVAGGHTTQSQAPTVRLARAATLDIRVVDSAGAALPRAGVAVTTDVQEVSQDENLLLMVGDIEEPAWRTMTDAIGRATITDLPPGAPLDVQAYQGALTRKLPRALRLEPGESRSLELRLGGGTLVRVSLVDRDHQPVPGQLIWCLPADVDVSDMLRLPEREVRARAITDGDGKLEFHDLPAGRWSLVLAPNEMQSTLAREAGLLPFVQPIVIQPNMEPLDVSVLAHRGEFIAGHVLDPRSQPVAHAHLLAHSASPDFHHASGESNADGAFRVGPLPRGRYELGARGHDEYADSLSVTVETGASDIVLYMRDGGHV